MSNLTVFTSLPDAQAFCSKMDCPMTVSIAGEDWRLFPSGTALRQFERFFYEMNRVQQQQAIQIYDGLELHQFVYTLDPDGNVASRRATRN